MKIRIRSTSPTARDCKVFAVADDGTETVIDNVTAFVAEAEGAE